MTWTAVITVIWNMMMACTAVIAYMRADRAERKCDILEKMMEGQNHINALQKMHLDRIEEFLHEIRKILQHNKT